MIERDELAARCLVALLARDYPSADAARFAVNMADALLARLRPAAPVREGRSPECREAADQSPRPEWVRLRGDHFRYPRIRRVVKWGLAGHPYVEGTTGPGETLTSDDLCRLSPDEWEPCAAPVAPAATDPRRTVGAVVKDPSGAVCMVVRAARKNAKQLLNSPYGMEIDAHDSDEFVRWATRAECEKHGIPFVDRTPPATTPAAYVPTPAKSGAAAYVPQVGDVVALAPNPFVSATDHRDSYGAHLYRVVRAQVDSDGCVECVRVDGRDTTSPCCISPGAMRPASASERAAAGLPPAEATRSVDREGLMKAIHDAIDKWHGCSSDERDIDEVRADAAIAYFKNGGVA